MKKNNNFWRPATFKFQNNYNDATLTAINAELEEGDYEPFLSIYFKKDNLYKQQLIKAFGGLLSQEFYEIVI